MESELALPLSQHQPPEVRKRQSPDMAEELLMFNQYILLKFSGMSSFQLQKSISVAKVVESPIYSE